jgi:integrase
MIAACSIRPSILFALYARHGLPAGGRITASGGPWRRKEALVATTTSRNVETDTIPSRLPTEDELRSAIDDLQKAVETYLHIWWSIRRISRAADYRDYPERALVPGDEQPAFEHVGRLLLFAHDSESHRVPVLVLTGIRRSEAQALRWRDVDLLEGVLRVRESKSEAGERSIALSPALRDVLTDQYRRTAFSGDDEFVFCHSERGSAYRPEWFREALTAALTAAGVEVGGLRPHHDPRHCSLTKGAAAGESPIALMTRAGHSNMATTKRTCT